MLKHKFSDYKSPLITSMILCNTPNECITKIKQSIKDGADAFGIQLCQIEKEYRSCENLTNIFQSCEKKPIYITSYRYGKSNGMSDSQCMEYLLTGVKCGAHLADVMGDLYLPNDEQFTFDSQAVKKQKELIDKIHNNGAEVLMSCHLQSWYEPSKVIEIAKAEEDRGADVLKIVTKSNSIDQLPEMIYIIQKILSNTSKKVLILDAGPCGQIIRRIGPQLGVLMYLCVDSYGELDTLHQPLVSDIRLIRDHWKV